jgi:hypothetical protein
MHVLVGLGILVGALWAFVAFRSFRIVIAILLVIGGVAYLTREKAAQIQQEEEIEKAQKDAEHEAQQAKYCEDEVKRWSIVQPSQIEIRSPSIEARFGDYRVVASAKNNSKSRITSLRADVVALDCQGSGASACETVGRSENQEFIVDIPAGEVRGLDQVVRFKDFPTLRGTLLPRLTVKRTRAAIYETDDSGLIEEWLYSCKPEKAAPLGPQK